MDIHESLLAPLPPASRAKLERLISDRDAARAAYRDASDREQEARQEAGLLEARARERLAMPAGLAIDMHPAGAVVEARRGLTKAGQTERDATEARLLAPVEAAQRRLQIALDARERAAERQAAFAFFETVEQWLSRASSLGGMRLSHYSPTPPKSRDPLAEIQKLRAELAALDEQWTETEDAPVPAAELRRAALAEIDDLAAKGALRINPLSRAGGPLDLARSVRQTMEPVRLPGDAAPTLMLAGTGAGPLLVWLHRDALVAKVDEMLAVLPQAGAMSDDEREREFTRINIRRLEIERIEESLTVAMEAEGRTIQRRRDADPRAVLEVVEA